MFIILVYPLLKLLATKCVRGFPAHFFVILHYPRIHYQQNMDAAVFLGRVKTVPLSEIFTSVYCQRHKWPTFDGLFKYGADVDQWFFAQRTLDRLPLAPIRVFDGIKKDIPATLNILHCHSKLDSLRLCG